MIEPTTDEESGQLFVLIDETLGIHAFAQTQEQAEDELCEQMLSQRDDYALEASERLTPGARG